MAPQDNEGNGQALDALRSYVLSRLDVIRDQLTEEAVRNQAARKDDIGGQMRWVQSELDTLRDDVKSRFTEVQGDMKNIIARFDLMEASVKTKMEELSSRSLKNIIAVQTTAMLIIIGFAVTLIELLVNR